MIFKMVQKIITFKRGVLTMFLFLSACGNAPNPPREVLFAGHVRSFSTNTTNDFFKTIDFDKYHAVLLGGDLMPDTTSDLAELNSIIDITQDNVLLAPGNHDYSFPELLPGNKVFHIGSTTFISLDTEAVNSQIEGAQLTFLTNAIAQAKQNIVIIHHKLIWLDYVGAANSVANSPRGSEFTYSLPNDLNFETDVYPLALNSGKRVIFIAGDVGNNTDQYEHTDANGITFLASGMGDSYPTSHLVLKITSEVSWEFKQ